MKFTLTFEGELPSTGNNPRRAAEKKWTIRKALHPQIKEACQTHPSLRSAFEHGTWVPNNGMPFFLGQHHHSHPNNFKSPSIDAGSINLCELISVGNRKFHPIVRESLALGCDLKILFLRREDPGSLVLQGGDLDNRLKTLFDGLRIPTEAELIEDPSIDDPIFCLLESDTLITGISIKTDRLLTGPNKSAHEVHLVIEADIRVLQSKIYNSSFLSS